MRFDFRLKGEKIWYLILILFLAISFRIFDKQIIEKLDYFKENEIGKEIIIISLFLCENLINLILSFLIIKNSINSIYLDDKAFVFSGQLLKFLGIVISSFFLMIFTLLIYTPFYIRRYINFISSNTYYNENNFQFNGKGGKLLGIMVLLLLLPYIAIVVLSLNLAAMTLKKIILFGIIFIIAFIMLTSYIFYYLRWLINFTYSDFDITLNAKANKSITFLLGQELLTILTLFIYLPTAIIKIIQHFASKIRIDNYTEKSYKIITEFETIKSWKYLGLQILLSIITFGIYLPWAYCNILRYIFERIVIEKEFSDSQQINIESK